MNKKVIELKTYLQESESQANALTMKQGINNRMAAA